VLLKVQEILHHVGLLCEGFEQEFMALLMTVEASHSQEESGSSSKLVNKGGRELKRLSFSITHDSKDSISI
jgi:hypothetical protein